MCKILAITKIDPCKKKVLIEKVWQAMYELGEFDGFGAAYSSHKGNIGYLKSSQSFVPPIAIPDFCDAFFDSNNLKSDGGPILIHSRTATCDISLKNTHPFIKDNRALVHNGIVSSSEYKNEISSCDSELLLHAFNAGGIEEVSNTIRGYYAFFSLLVKDGKVILDIVRDATARLEVGIIKSTGAFVFATTKELIEIVGGEYVAPFSTCCDLTITDGKVTSIKQFKPLPNIIKAVKKEDLFKSLGVEVNQ